MANSERRSVADWKSACNSVSLTTENTDVNGLVTDHFFNPRNVGDTDEPSFAGRAASLTCGAHVRFSIQVDANHTVSQARFRAAGCNVLVAAASLLTEEVQGLNTVDAAALAQEPSAIAERLGDERCVSLACDALVDAIRAFSDAARDDWAGDEALICTCFFVSERTIESKIRTGGLTTVAEVTEACNAGGGCGSCQPLIEEIIATSTNDN